MASLDDTDRAQVFELRYGGQAKEVSVLLTESFGTLQERAAAAFGLAPGCKVTGLAPTIKKSKAAQADMLIGHFVLKSGRMKLLVIGSPAAAVADMKEAEALGSRACLADEEDNYAEILAQTEAEAARGYGIPKGAVDPREKVVILKPEQMRRRVVELAYAGLVDQMRRLLMGEGAAMFSDEAVAAAVVGNSLAAVRYLLAMRHRENDRFGAEMRAHLESRGRSALPMDAVHLATRLARLPILQFLLDVLCVGWPAAEVALETGIPARLPPGLSDESDPHTTELSDKLCNVLRDACKCGHLALAKWLHGARRAKATLECLAAALVHDRVRTCQWLVSVGVRPAADTITVAVRYGAFNSLIGIWPSLPRDAGAFVNAVVHAISTGWGAPGTGEKFLRFLLITALHDLPESQLIVRTNLVSWLRDAAATANVAKLRVLIEVAAAWQGEEHAVAHELDLTRPYLKRLAPTVNDCLLGAVRAALKARQAVEYYEADIRRTEQSVAGQFQRPGERASGVAAPASQILRRVDARDHQGEQLKNLRQSLHNLRTELSNSKRGAWEAREVVALLVTQGCDPAPLLQQMSEDERFVLVRALQQRLDEERWVDNAVKIIPDAVPELFELPQVVILVIAQYSAKSDGRHQARYQQELGDFLELVSRVNEHVADQHDVVAGHV